MVTELETPSSFDTARAEPDVLDAPAESRRPVVVLGAIIVGTFLVYALLTTGIDGPRVHPDEERTWGVGRASGRRGERPGPGRYAAPMAATAGRSRMRLDVEGHT